MELKQFKAEELCRVGFGVKMHIRGYYRVTLCGRSPISNISLPIISIREDSDNLCRTCVAEYKGL